MLKTFGIIALSLILGGAAMAQEGILSAPANNVNAGANLNVLYTRDMSGAFIISARGIGFSFQQSRHITARTRSFYDIGLFTLKHPKEINTTGDAENKKKFVYGKINHVMVLRGTLGMRNVLFAKADNKAVEVRYSYSIGPAFAFAKPYYVRVYKLKAPGIQQQYVNVKFDTDNFTKDSGTVMGRAPYQVGLGEMKIYPGITAKFNISFEYSPESNLIRAIETGVLLDYYPKALPLMARNPSENLIANVYVGFVFGNKRF